MFQTLATALLLRTISRDLAAIATTLQAQTALLARLADQFAPPFPVEPSRSDRQVITADTGVSHVDPDDVALAEYFTARSQAATGHTPDEEEILLYLGDERTKDLGQRLEQRDAELQRLMEARRG